METTVVLAAVLGALAPIVFALALTVPAEVDRHDRQLSERDQLLEEWIVQRDRELLQRFREIKQEAAARGVGGTSIQAGHTAVRAMLLYDYRSELREARSFALELEVAERRAHRIWRRMKRRPFPHLAKPAEAAPILDYWMRGTSGNALTWGIADIVSELPTRRD